jgi:hypothetical protein
MNYLAQANSLPLYLISGGLLLFVAFVCALFMVKSYKAGLKIGMDKKVLRKAITSSATFTILPSVAILLGVIALSGSLGVPISWLRLSVVGNLQYEATVANIAAEQMGTSLDSSVLTMNNLVTIMLTMTVGIIWGALLSLITLKPYSNKLSHVVKKPQQDGEKRTSFADWAMTAMMIGLCATFIGSYTATAFVKGNITPIVTTLVSGAFMLLFQSLSKNEKLSFLDNFSLALSMLFGMAAAVVVELL